MAAAPMWALEIPRSDQPKYNGGQSRPKGPALHAHRLVAVRRVRAVAPEVPDHDPRSPGRRRTRVGDWTRLCTARVRQDGAGGRRGRARATLRVHELV